MSFIGIIAESKNEGYINKIISNKLHTNTIININEKNIDNIKNVRFETLLISGNNKSILEKEELLKSIISNVQYLIINADIETNLSVLKHLNLKVITFGFNSKSTITASSVKEDTILICIQRTIEDNKKQEIEPQEVLVQLQENNISVHSIMGIVSVLLIYGIKDFKL